MLRTMMFALAITSAGLMAGVANATNQLATAIGGYDPLAYFTKWTL